MPRVVSVQNPYFLLNRSYEVAFAEVSNRERPGVLAYLPSGFGVLSGKYLFGAMLEGSRLNFYPDYARYSSENSSKAMAMYVSLAKEHGLKPAQMALAYINDRAFITANIIGATKM